MPSQQLERTVPSYRVCRPVRAAGYSCAIPESILLDVISAKSDLAGVTETRKRFGKFTLTGRGIPRKITVRVRLSRGKTIQVPGFFVRQFTMLSDAQCAISFRVRCMTVRHRLRRGHSARPPFQRKRISYEDHHCFWRLR